MKRRRVVIVGDWGFCLQYADWEIRTANDVVTSEEEDQERFEEGLRDIDGQRLTSVHRDPDNKTLELKFDLGGVVRAWPTSCADPKDRPDMADWADPASTIPGFALVTDGTIRAGDVLATPKRIPKSWYHGGGQQLGIATGNGTSIGIVDDDRIGENTFGVEDGHNPVVWRATPGRGCPGDGEC